MQKKRYKLLLKYKLCVCVLTREEIKARLETLVKKYKALGDERKDYPEEETRLHFIDDLLTDVLEWKKDWLQANRPIKSSENNEFPDYWYPKWSPKVIVEAKRLGLDKRMEEHQGEFDRQAKGYAVSTAASFAILTNFRYFKAWYISRYNEYPFANADILDSRGLDRYVDALYYFQNDNVLGSGLMDEIEKRNYNAEAMNLPRDFGEALNRLRLTINGYLSDEYHIPDAQKEEITQGLIDRLIFIKKVEADGIEIKKLEQIYRNVHENKYTAIRKLFIEYRSKYDTDIFGERNVEQRVEKIDINDGKTTLILDALSGTKKPINADYQYQLMGVDILGSIYESYLAFVQKGEKLVGGKGKRRVQGIYYTPKAIVDYIVANTIDPKLPIEEVKNLKILDLACGSGSFLIGAMGNLDSYYQQQLKGYKEFPPSDRLETFKKNIFGVDLDERATRIAELSVYLKTLTLTPPTLLRENHFSLLMPPLHSNIKVGNSIIDDDLAAEGKGFHWKERFEDIMRKGGFDIVIGNPPYIDYREVKGNSWLKEHYASTQVKEKYNALIVFIERGLQVLKEGGRLGFIVTSAFLAQDFGKELRKLILKTCEIEQLIDVSKIKIFKDASTYPVIIILKKVAHPSPHNRMKLAVLNSIDELFNGKHVYTHIEQQRFSEIVNDIFVTPLTEQRFKLMKKIEDGSTRLSEIIEKKNGLTWGTSASGFGKKKLPARVYREMSAEEKHKYVKLIKTSDIQRFHTYWKGDYIEKRLFSDKKLELFQKNKIIVGRLTKVLRASIDNEFNGYGKVALLFLKNEYNPEYVLGLLNSRLFNFYYTLLFWSTHMSGGYFSYDISMLRHLPIKIGNRDEETALARLVEKAISLNEELDKLGDSGEEQKAEIKESLARLDRQIDNKVYDIYRISDGDRKLIDSSLAELVIEPETTKGNNTEE